MITSHKLIKCFLAAIILLIGTSACAPQTKLQISADRSVSGKISVLDGDKTIAEKELIRGKCAVKIPRGRNLILKLNSSGLSFCPEIIKIGSNQEEDMLHLADKKVELEYPQIMYDSKVTIKFEALDDSFESFSKEQDIKDIKAPLILTIPDNTPIKITASASSCASAVYEYTPNPSSEAAKAILLKLSRNEGRLDVAVSGFNLDKAQYKLSNAGKVISSGPAAKLNGSFQCFPLNTAYELTIFGPNIITCKKTFKPTAESPDQDFSCILVRNEGKINFAITGDSMDKAKYKIMKHGKQIAGGTAKELNGSVKYLPFNTTYDVIIFGPALATCKQSFKPTIAKPEISLKLTANVDISDIMRDANQFFKACRQLQLAFNKMIATDSDNDVHSYYPAVSRFEEYILPDSLHKLLLNEAYRNDSLMAIGYITKQSRNYFLVATVTTSRRIDYALTCKKIDTKQILNSSDAQSWSYVNTNDQTVTICHNKTGIKMNGIYNKKLAHYEFDYYALLRDHTSLGRLYNL
ncbi:MAG: hypothetical protein Q4F00_02185 [bacterium]|nr:hypothetical protein [bacterium]